MPYVTDGRIILQYRSGTTVLPRNKLFFNTFSVKAKFFPHSVICLLQVSLLSMLTPNNLVWYTQFIVSPPMVIIDWRPIKKPLYME